MNVRFALQLIAASAFFVATVALDAHQHVMVTVPNSGTPRLCFSNASNGDFICELNGEIFVDCGSLDNGRHAFDLLVVAAGFPGADTLQYINVTLHRFVR
jgi:hypothetical protein